MTQGEIITTEHMTVTLTPTAVAAPPTLPVQEQPPRFLILVLCQQEQVASLREALTACFASLKRSEATITQANVTGKREDGFLFIRWIGPVEWSTPCEWAGTAELEGFLAWLRARADVQDLLFHDPRMIL